jgi:large subunit ribosomal protein L10
MDKKKKQEVREAVAGKLGDANAVIVTEYRGLTVEQVTALRVQLRKAKAEYKVVKNRIAKKAIEEHAKEFEGMKDALKGPVGLVYVFGDFAQAAKATLDFQKDNEIFEIKSAFSEGSLMTKAQLVSIADLPSKEVLLGQIVGSLINPHRNLLGVLSGVQRKVVQVINAIKETKTA